MEMSRAEVFIMNKAPESGQRDCEEEKHWEVDLGKRSREDEGKKIDDKRGCIHDRCQEINKHEIVKENGTNTQSFAAWTNHSDASCGSLEPSALSGRESGQAGKGEKTAVGIGCCSQSA